MSKIISYRQEALIESFKMFGRIALFTALPLLITGLETGRVDWRVIGTGTLIAVLKGLDEYLHELGTLTGNPTLTKGLSRF